MQTKTIKYPMDQRWRIELDRDEIFPDDPGNGTPAMVYSPRNLSATYDCACNTGELDCGTYIIPDAVLFWLQSQSEVIEQFLWPDG